MAGSVALDTSVIIEHFRNDAAVTGQMLDAGALVLPAITLGERYTGAIRKTRGSEVAVSVVDDFARLCRVIPIDALVAREYGRLRADLAARGRPIPDNDLWIAAVAVAHRLPLANRDTHFDAVDGLDQLKW